jgi:Holliday junction resolvase-like predicted endonuclease
MTPAQSVTTAKVERVRRAAAQWLRNEALPAVQVRFDVASVLFDTPDGRLNYLEGAF